MDVEHSRADILHVRILLRSSGNVNSGRIEKTGPQEDN